MRIVYVYMYTSDQLAVAVLLLSSYNFKIREKGRPQDNESFPRAIKRRRRTPGLCVVSSAVVRVDRHSKDLPIPRCRSWSFVYELSIGLRVFDENRRSVSESKIESLVALVCRRSQVGLLLFFRHSLPFFFSSPIYSQRSIFTAQASSIADGPVDSNVEDFRSNKQATVVCDNTKQHLITSEVVRTVRGTVDLGWF
jgi:hypothetical protein